MNAATNTRHGSIPRRLSVFIAGTLAAIGVALLTFLLVMHPPQSDFMAMSAFLSVTALISVSIGIVAYRLGWMRRRSPKLVWILMGGYLLAAGLTFVNVLLTARLMFLSRHDLLLSTVLLVFAAIIAASLGYLLSSAVASSVSGLSRAVGRVASGELDVEVVTEGPQEIAGLARSFNLMTARLREAEQERAAVETARRDLLTAVGHDLRTPLTSIQVIIEALSDDIVDDAETVRRYLRTAQGELATLSRLVDDLFMIAQLDAGGVELDLQPNSMTDLVSDTLESFSVRAERQRVTLRGEPCPDGDIVSFDARYVGRALANLVDNALRYTPPGGEVVLSTSVVPGGLCVRVRDSGQGITAEDAQRVFDRFYRGEESRNRATGGSGLGLAIVKSVVEAHGGRVGVESAPGGGTAFSFVLPRWQTIAAEA
jgi:signal transduction histidine kinase